MRKTVIGVYDNRQETEQARSYIYAKHGVVLDMERRTDGRWQLVGWDF